MRLLATLLLIFGLSGASALAENCSVLMSTLEHKNDDTATFVALVRFLAIQKNVLSANGQTNDGKIEASFTARDKTFETYQIFGPVEKK